MTKKREVVIKGFDSRHPGNAQWNLLRSMVRAHRKARNLPADFPDQVTADIARLLKAS